MSIGCQRRQYKLVDGRVRDSALVYMRDEAGHHGWGEIAPLPGFSEESFEQALTSFGRREQVLPSVVFGWEIASAQLAAAKEGETLRGYLSDDAPPILPVAGLVDLRLAAVERELDYAVVKVKVGGLGPQDAYKALKGFVAEHAVTLRIDVNQGWTNEQAWEFAALATDLPIEYLEEPTEDPDFYTQAFPLPLAVDETLRVAATRLYNFSAAVKAIVIKPMLMGGLDRIDRLCRAAYAHDMYPVISSSFESSVGLMALAEIAAVYQPQGVAAGLDTWSWLEEDVIEMENPIHGGYIDCRKWDDLDLTAALSMQAAP